MRNFPDLAPLRYSIAEAVSLLGLSRSTLYARVADGRIAIHKDGRRTFILAIELDRYLMHQTQAD